MYWTRPSLGARSSRRRSAGLRFAAVVGALGLIIAGQGADAAPRARNKLVANRGGALPSLPAGVSLPAAAQRGLSLGLFGGSQIRYHNGPLMLGATNVYAIWAGSWNFSTVQDSSTKAIVENYFHQPSGSPYFNINTTYTQGTVAGSPKVTNAVNFVSDMFVPLPANTTLSDSQVESTIANAIHSGTLKDASGAAMTAPDPSGVYFLLTSKDVGESSGFLTTYCAFHDHVGVSNPTTGLNVDTKYAFAGDASRNLAVCAGQTASSPNNNPAADAMVNVSAHELEEAVTDPDLNAWYDSSGNENADKCAWKFGTTQTASNGSKYNMTISGKQYLIQQNWLNVGRGSCALSY
jgi:hypothetical protein